MRLLTVIISTLCLAFTALADGPVINVLPGQVGNSVQYLGPRTLGPSTGVGGSNSTVVVGSPTIAVTTNNANSYTPAVAANSITSNQLASTTIDLSNFTPSATNWLFLVASNYAWTLSQNGTNYAALTVGVGATNEVTRKTQIVNTNVPANYALYGPTSGGAAAPFFRFMVSADMATNYYFVASTGITIVSNYSAGVWTYTLSSPGGGGQATNAIGNLGGTGTNTTIYTFLNVLNSSGTVLFAISNNTVFVATNILLAAGVGITNAAGGSINFSNGTNILSASNLGGNLAFLVTSNGIVVAGTNAQMTLDTSGNLTIKGQFNGSGAGLTAASVPVAALANTGTAGTYTKTTFNAQGVETSGASAVLASADFANQGTTTTVLHGNAAGNPSFGQIVNSDITAGTIANASLANSAITIDGVSTSLGGTAPDSRNYTNGGFGLIQVARSNIVDQIQTFPTSTNSIVAAPGSTSWLLQSATPTAQTNISGTLSASQWVFQILMVSNSTAAAFTNWITIPAAKAVGYAATNDAAVLGFNGCIVPASSYVEVLYKVRLGQTNYAVVNP